MEKVSILALLYNITQMIEFLQNVIDILFFPKNFLEPNGGLNVYGWGRGRGNISAIQITDFNIM